MLEYEKKIILTYQEYMSILKFKNKACNSYVQTNYYYDTDNFEMNEIGITYRIREKQGKYKATVKKHNFKNGKCNIERYAYVKNERDTRFFENNLLKLQGALKTERIVFVPHDGIAVALDKNLYLGVIDYELEVEYLPQIEFLIESVLGYYALELRYSGNHTSEEEFISRANNAKSKSHRFFERKKELLKKGNYEICSRRDN